MNKFLIKLNEDAVSSLRLYIQRVLHALFHALFYFLYMLGCIALCFGGCDSTSNQTSKESDAMDMMDLIGGMNLEPEGGHMEEDMMPEGPWLKMGTGFRRFETLEAQQRVPIIAGIQGGFHVWGAFQAGGFLGENVNVLFNLYLGDRHLAQADYFEYFLPENSDGTFEYTGVSVIYFQNEDVEPTSGQTMRLTLEVKNEEGVLLTDELEVIPECCQ